MKENLYQKWRQEIDVDLVSLLSSCIVHQKALTIFVPAKKKKSIWCSIIFLALKSSCWFNSDLCWERRTRTLSCCPLVTSSACLKMSNVAKQRILPLNLLTAVMIRFKRVLWKIHTVNSYYLLDTDSIILRKAYRFSCPIMMGNKRHSSADMEE